MITPTPSPQPTNEPTSSPKPRHIAIVSVLLDHKPEGICTGRLLRALLARGHRVTVITSTKARPGLTHPNLEIVALPHGPREPLALFWLIATLRGHLFGRFYAWTRRAQAHSFAAEAVPDVIYGRAWPLSSLIPAFYLARRYRRPLIVHLSDPVPPADAPPATRRRSRIVQTIVDAAAAVTLVNHQTIPFQKRYLDVDDGKLHILTHVGPEPVRLQRPPEGPPCLFYVGSIGAFRRDAVAIALAGFKVWRNTHPGARLVFVGTKRSELEPLLAKVGLDTGVELRPFHPEPRELLHEATALLLVDPEVPDPVWTTTKFVESVVTDRRILALTTAGSPAAEFLADHPDSAALVTDYQTDAMAAGYARLAALTCSDEAIASRWDAARMFSGDVVAARFEAIIDAVLADPAQ